MVRRYIPKGNRGFRLWITGELGAPDAWRLSPDAWRRLENSYGSSLDASLRADITKAVRSYLDWVAAPQASEFLLKLERARKVSRELRSIVNSFGDAGSMVASHWEKYFPDDIKNSTDAPDDEDIAALFDWTASTKSTRRGRDHRCFDEVVSTICGTLDDVWIEATHRKDELHSASDTWRQLVNDLADTFRKRGLKVTATKDNYRQQSPFVRFIGELHKSFPTGSVQSFGDAALSQAVYQAIKLKQKKLKTGENCPNSGAKVSPKGGKL